MSTSQLVQMPSIIGHSNHLTWMSTTTHPETSQIVTKIALLAGNHYKLQTVFYLKLWFLSCFQIISVQKDFTSLYLFITMPALLVVED